MLGTPSVGADEDWAGRVPVEPDMPTEGGGATTFVPRVVPTALCTPRGLPLGAFALTAGGGGTTLAASEVRALSLGPFERTAGGGGTTSVAPKILPIRLLMNDPLPDCVGGGGTTVFDGSGMLPLVKR